MNLNGKNHALLEPLAGLGAYGRIMSCLENSETRTLWADGVVDAQKWHMTAGILSEKNRPALIIAPSELKAKAIYEDLYYFFREACHIYPSRDLIFFAADVKSVDITRQRLRVLERLYEYEQKKIPAQAPIVILSAEALLDRMPPPTAFHRYRLSLSVGDICEPEDAVRRLVQMGYERSGLVEGPGQIALRGGILDIYPAVARYKSYGESQNDSGSKEVYLLEGQALRIEFFDDEVDSVRLIDAISQRSIENASGFDAYPVRELVFGTPRLKRAMNKIREALDSQKDALTKEGKIKEAKALTETIEETLDNWDTERCGASRNAEAFLPFFYEDECNLLDYIPQNTLVFFDEPNQVSIHMETAWAEYRESIGHRLLAGRMLPQQVEIMLPWEQIIHKSGKFNRLLYSSMAAQLNDFSDPIHIPVSARALSPLRHKPNELRQDLTRLLDQGYIVALLAGARRHGEQIAAALNDMDILSRFSETLIGVKLATNLVTVARGTLSAGFEYPEIKLAVITDKELFTAEKARRRKRRKEKNAEKISHFTDLRIGDYIVHDNHGIGVFRGIEQVTSDGLTRDYLKLEYADSGNLYIQTAQMDMIQKYIGGKEDAKLSKLGGTAWAKAKSRVRQAVEIMAADLIELYAKRIAAKAHVYSHDNVWQTEFEAQFPYTETDDQTAAIEDVKRDMESSKVMDRLICGDVGYGKTEVAIRAAFKAVQDGKQVAYLVPTTILAQQHYLTFSSRMRAYPINVDRLSRFQSKKEQKETLKNMEKGGADIVIGTHRLLSKDVKFKDLGLIIVDEEQRFGVGHKEKLKEMRANVDVLTLTATPIPRTLHFSLTGIRDMSLLDEPPEERQPVQTYVMEFNAEFTRDAINRELARGGQVYYLHNRVINISEEAMRVATLVPQARVAFAHVQMSEIELENVMHDFVEGDVDVLVCTTIIETGLDIPNVNTIIIQNADFMGLSQLYQLRGRVGRSSRLAYAYLMYRRDKVLREEAEKRLQTIREFTEFGAGFKIAMRDLEIRGAGNLLGAQQHGHMDSVGYDMYSRLLAEAVANLKGEPMQDERETNIDISVDAHIPSRVIPDEQQKLEIYKKISLISSEQDYRDIEEEIEDRFGILPPPVVNLLDIALMKAKARGIGVSSITQKGQNIVIVFQPDASVDLEKLTALLTENPTRLLFTMAQNPYITIRAHKGEKPPEDGGATRIREISELIDKIIG